MKITKKILISVGPMCLFLPSLTILGQQFTATESQPICQAPGPNSTFRGVYYVPPNPEFDDPANITCYYVTNGTEDDRSYSQKLPLNLDMTGSWEEQGPPEFYSINYHCRMNMGPSDVNSCKAFPSS